MMDFERSLSRQEFDSWLDLLDSLKDISLTGNKVLTTKIVHCAKIRTSDPLSSDFRIGVLTLCGNQNF